MNKKEKEQIKKNGIRFSKVVIIFCIISIIFFTASVLFVFYHTSSEPTAIITAFFSFMIGEVFALAKLKLNEINKELTSQTLSINKEQDE